MSVTLKPAGLLILVLFSTVTGFRVLDADSSKIVNTSTFFAVIFSVHGFLKQHLHLVGSLKNELTFKLIKN